MKRVDGNPERRKVLLIYTGGTIGMKTDPESGALVPFDFTHIGQEFPVVRRLNVDIEVLPFDPIDSSNASPALWRELAAKIEENYHLFDGFVVLHGTDTMSYTSSALSFMLRGLAKPVVFTGSQIPIGVLRTDGRENLITAIEIAAATDAEGRARVSEVSLYFQNRLFRANRSTKQSAERLSAFASYNYPPLAEVGVNIAYNDAAIHHPAEDEEFGVESSLACDVMVVKLFPGLTEQTLNAMLSVEGLRGVILETYGSGNAPSGDWFIDSLRRAMERGVCVMNVTQCADGKVDMDLYETGRRMQELGVISGKDITLEAAVTKMMFMLGKNLSEEQLKLALKTSFRGEMNE